MTSQPQPTPLPIIPVRPALPSEAAQVRDLRLEALANSPTAFTADLALTQAETVSHWEQRISAYARENLGVFYVAGQAGALVGMARIEYGDRPKTRHSGFILSVYVQPACRGLRLGEALVMACVEQARAAGLVVVKLGVNATNLPAIRCYARCGFSVYGIEPKTIFYEGVYYDELLMARPV